jgi:NitT/TauT family transport system substrate-binding protein
MKTRKTLVAPLAAALTLGLTLTACTVGDTETPTPTPDATDSTETSGELTKVKLQLQWLTQGQFAGYYAALSEGFYEDEGLDVEIIPSGGDIVPQDALAQGEVDYAIAWVPKVLGSIEQGANITNVAQIFERSATLQVSFKDADITSPADLAGKKVGSWGYGNEWELFAGLNKADVTDFELVTQAFDMLGLLNGDIETPTPASSTPRMTSTSSIGTTRVRQCSRTQSGLTLTVSPQIKPMRRRP